MCMIKNHCTRRHAHPCTQNLNGNQGKQSTTQLLADRPDTGATSVFGAPVSLGWRFLTYHAISIQKARVTSARATKSGNVDRVQTFQQYNHIELVDRKPISILMISTAHSRAFRKLSGGSSSCNLLCIVLIEKLQKEIQLV